MHFTAVVKKSLLVASLVAPWLVAAADGSDVLDLTSSTFESTIAEEGLILVEFFAPWCGHCKALAPEYEKSATELKAKGIKLAKVDCVDQADLCTEKGIGGYPTLKVYRNGTPSDYAGPREATGIVSYMTKQSLPAVSTVTIDNLEKFSKSDKVVVIAFASSHEDPHVVQFNNAASTHRDDYLFGITTDAEAAKAAGVTPPAVVLYKSFDEGRNELENADKATAGDVASFIKAHSMPLVDEINGENYAKYSATGLPLAYLFIDPTDSKKADIVKGLTALAKEQKGKLNFVWIDAVKFGEHGKSLALEPTWPAFVIQDVKGQLKYPLSQKTELSIDGVKALVAEFIDGKIEPTLKSEAVPEQTEKYYQLVGTEFEKVVYDDDKDVFLQISAPWCGHCKRLLPTWEELAGLYSDADKLVIAKMDGTENDLPKDTPFTIEGFPTIKFKPAGTRAFHDYTGDRSIESLIEFVQTHSTNKVEAPKVPEKAAPATEEVPVTVVDDAEAAPAPAHEEL